MNNAQTLLGASIRALRERKGITQENLAAKAGISYQYLSGVETGKENFSVQVLEALSSALDVPLSQLVQSAYEAKPTEPPKLNPRFFRSGVPLPDGLTLTQLEDAINRTQWLIHRINRNLISEAGQSLRSFIQGNNFSGLVSNVLTDSFDKLSSYKHNNHQKYPDLIQREISASPRKRVGLEIKCTINIGKGGESHNGHCGWHLVGCYQFVEQDEIEFVHVMIADLNGHDDKYPHWKYVGSKVNESTGSQRTETYVTNLKGTTALRDGSVYVNTERVSSTHWKQERDGEVPSWSIFSCALPTTPG